MRADHGGILFFLPQGSSRRPVIRPLLMNRQLAGRGFRQARAPSLSEVVMIALMTEVLRPMDGTSTASSIRIAFPAQNTAVPTKPGPGPIRFARILAR